MSKNAKVAAKALRLGLFSSSRNENWTIRILPELEIFCDQYEFGIELSWLCWGIELAHVTITEDQVNEYKARHDR